MLHLANDELVHFGIDMKDTDDLRDTDSPRTMPSGSTTTIITTYFDGNHYDTGIIDAYFSVIISQLQIQVQY